METTRRMTSRTFEDLLDEVGTKGRINYTIFFAACIGGWLTGMHSFAYQFLGATPDHWCNIPELSMTNWTQDQLKYIAIPATIHTIMFLWSPWIAWISQALTEDGKRSYYKCEMYALNYTELSALSFTEAVSSAKEMLNENNNTFVHCYKRHFDSEFVTVVTKWDLVCERRVLYSTTQAGVQIGMLIGFVFFGWCIDRFGRSYTYKRCLILYIIFEVSTLLSSSVEMFIFMRVVTALMGAGFYLAGFVISVELCSTKQRSSIANYYVIPWSVGMMMVAAFSTVFLPWWQLQIALFVPAFLLIPNLWILPESPRWLILQQRYDDAYKILKRIADANGNQLTNKETLIDDMKQIQISMKTSEEFQEEEINKTVAGQVLSSLKPVFRLLDDPSVRTRTICIFICFFATSFVYYGVSLADPSITDNNSLYLFIAGALEIPSYLILWPSVSYFGRRKSLMVFFLVAGSSILLAMCLQLVDSTNNFYVLKLLLFLLGKVGITAAFHLLWVFTAELYPTKYRSLAVGEGSSVARIGSFFSSYVKDLLGAKVIWSPAAIFGGFALLAALNIKFLPETTDKILPDNIQEITSLNQPADRNSTEEDNL